MNLNITMPIYEIDDQYVHFLSTRKNNIIQDGVFTKIIYSNSVFSSQGVNISFETIPDARTFFSMDIYPRMHEISVFEMNLLDKYAKHYNCINKRKQLYFTISQLQHQLLTRLQSRQVEMQYTHVIIKISGVWETNDQIGITYVLKGGYQAIM